VLGQINRGWYRLHPRDLHPKFQTAVLAEVTQHMLDARENGRLDPHLERAYRRWQEICGIAGNEESR
jgi:hypothetical protein